MQEATGSSTRKKPFIFMAGFSLAFVAVFATPLSVALSNRAAINLPVWGLALSLLILAGGLSWIAARLTYRADDKVQARLSAAMISLACVLAIQANVIHPLTYFGAFDGDLILFRQYGVWFWIELIAFFGLLGILFIGFRRWPEGGQWAGLLAVASSALVLGQSAWEAGGESEELQDVQPSVYEFSSRGNLVHLLPDGLQTDTVVAVLENDPELAAAFEGFSLFTDHLGPYHGTAPSLPAMLTGEPFDFSRGHIYTWIGPHIEQKAYPNKLVESGWTVDMVPIHEVYCIDRSRSCLPRPFNDWKSRGIEQFEGESLAYALAVLADLSLYRMSPSFLKEKIHDHGNWFLAGATADGASPFPDPVLREWSESMTVVDGPPAYRLYHYIGTHKPPFWNANCTRNERPGREKADFEAQAACILKGIAAFLGKLKEQGIYENSAVMITGDHGHGTAPEGLQNADLLPGIDASMVATARPVLLVKPVSTSGPLRFNTARSSLTDIAGLGVSLATGEALHEFESNLADRSRNFYRYSIEGMRRWEEKPIDHETFLVDGPVLDGSSWSLAGITLSDLAPSAFSDMNYRTVGQFVRGVDIRTGDEEQRGAWIRQPKVGFLLSLPGLEERPMKLVLKFHLPEWIDQQSFSARLNGSLLADHMEFQRGNDFFSWVSIPLPENKVLNRNNFFILSFDRPHQQPGSDREAYAMLAALSIEPISSAGL